MLMPYVKSPQTLRITIGHNQKLMHYCAVLVALHSKSGYTHNPITFFFFVLLLGNTALPTDFDGFTQ